MSDLTVECFCGEGIPVSTKEVLEFAITICPRCDSEVSLEEMYDDVIASIEIKSTIYGESMT